MLELPDFAPELLVLSDEIFKPAALLVRHLLHSLTSFRFPSASNLSLTVSILYHIAVYMSIYFDEKHSQIYSRVFVHFAYSRVDDNMI